MTQHDDWHLTIEQLSAWLDQQLSPQEQATCNAHLQTCRQCQSALADLKRTVALLHALPKPELPRSFMLPTDVAYLQDHGLSQPSPVPATASSQSRRLWQYYLQRSVRAMSTIAAVVGIVLIMSGMLATFTHSGVGMSSTNSGFMAPSSARLSPATQPGMGNATTTASHNKGVTPVPTLPGGHTPAATSTTQHPQQSTNPAEGQAALDLNSPFVRQGIGFSLLLLGILGVFFSRRKQRKTRTT